MSNSSLNSTNAGRVTLRDVFGHLANFFPSRRLRRRFYLFYRNWFYGEHASTLSPSLGMLVDELNAAHDTELTQIREAGARYGIAWESVQDETYYVDPVNGSDTTGNGSAALPFASLSWLPYFLPRRIDHHYRIVILGDLTEEVLQISPEFGPNGSIAFIGSGEPVVSDSRTLSAANNYQGFYEATASVGGFSDDQYTGYFIRCDGFSAQDEAHPIFHHDAAGVFKTPWPWAGGLAGGVDVSFLVPQHTLAVAGLSIGSASPKVVLTDNGEEYGSRIGFFNLNIDVRNTAKAPALNFDARCGVVMSFVRLMYNDGVELPMQLTSTDLNVDKHVDPEIDNLADCTISNLNEDPEVDTPAGLSLHNVDDGHASNHTVLKITGVGEIAATMTRQTVYYLNASYRNRICQMNALELETADLWCLFQGCGSRAGSHSINLNGASLRFISMSIFNHAGGSSQIYCGAPGSFIGQCTLGIGAHDVAGSAVGFTGYGVQVASPTTMQCTVQPSQLVGVVSDILWETVAAPVANNWPVAGAIVFDPLNCSFAHVKP